MNKEFLKELLATPSPSGEEERLNSIFDKYLFLTPNVNKEFVDNSQSICYSIPSVHGKRRLLLSAHCDEISLRVSYIDEKGFVHFIANGGVDPKVLLGATVQNCDGSLKGVIGKMPVHLEWRGENKDAVTKISDMKVDFGFEDAEEAKNAISIGDNLVVCDMQMDLGKNRFCGRGLDDKVGVFIIAEVLKALSGMKLRNVSVYGALCSQEETSASGAVSVAKKIDPHYSIDYDVTFATDDEHVKPQEWGDIKLGKGGAIAHSVDCNKNLVTIIKNVCKKNDIPYQEFALTSGGTNTVYLKQNSNNCMNALLSIPNRNMHTQVEVCDYRDLESLIQMTVQTILAIDSSMGIKQ